MTAGRTEVAKSREPVRAASVIFRKGTARDRVAMNGASRHGSADRDRAVARLRTITIGTGLAGVVAVGGFGAIAAASYDGASTTDGALTAAVTTDSAAVTATPSATSTDTSTTSASSSGLSTTTAPTTTTGSPHAVTGSS
jgi:hypothetical protein